MGVATTISPPCVTLSSWALENAFRRAVDFPSQSRRRRAVTTVEFIDEGDDFEPCESLARRFLQPFHLNH